MTAKRPDPEHVAAVAEIVTRELGNGASHTHVARRVITTAPSDVLVAELRRRGAHVITVPPATPRSNP